jgi:hypothetical protein
MHQSLSKLVTRFAAPATSVFNKALVGAFAVAGASVGAVAGAVAARAASRGVSVLRGAGVGAVAGAAVSVEALDLARMCLSGYSVAGAMERRESRLALMQRDADERPPRDDAAAGGRRRGGRDALLRRDGPTDLSGRETGSGSGSGSHHRRRARGRRFAASTFSVASSSSSNVSNVERRAESPVSEARAERGGARPLAIRARRAEVDARAREMERALARGDVERILHELFRGGGGSSYAAPSSYVRSRDDENENEQNEVIDAVSPRTLSDAEFDRASEFENENENENAAWRGYGSDDGGGSGQTEGGLSDAGSNEGDGGFEGDFENDDGFLRESERSGRADSSWTGASLSLHRALEAMLTASRLDTMTYEELLDRFGPGDPGVPVAPIEAVRAIPTRRVRRRDLRGCHFKNERKNQSAACTTRFDGDDAAQGDSSETSSEMSSEMSSDSEAPLGGSACRDFSSTSACERCVVCLEAWRVGAEIKSLRGCRHTFHAACIDRWLTEERNACPVCRRAGVELRRDGGGELEGNDVAK